MVRSILSVERTERRILEGSEYLYRDHLGREVVLDVEGAGRYFCVGPPNATIEVDGRIVQETEGVFEQSVLITKPNRWRAMAFATTSPVLPFPLPSPIPVQSRYIGCGWVVAARGAVIADGRLDGDGINPLFPTPFFREAYCAEGFTVVVDPSTRCELVDRFSIDDGVALGARGWRVQNVSAITVLDSTDELGRGVRGAVASHLNRASWRVAIPAENRGLILRRSYDRFHGRQRARVFVDGVLAGWWYEASQDRVRRWGLGDFGIAAEFTAGKSEVEIGIDPPGGAPLWSVGDYSLFALLPNRA